MAEQNSIRQFNNPLFREIHKNTWLKKVPNNESKKKKERVWVTFCVHDDTEAFLEYYQDNKTAVLHKPDWFISLNDTQHVSPTICAHEQEYEFVITLSNEVIRLAAPTWDLMIDWVEGLRSKLYELRILSPKENLYSKLPETHKNAPLLSTRDPMSPLPPPPLNAPPQLPGVEMTLPSISQNATYDRRHPVLQRGISLPETTSYLNTVFESNTSNSATVGQLNGQSARSNDTFDFENFNILEVNTSFVVGSQTRNDYERLFQLQHSPGPSSRQPQIGTNSPRRLQPPPLPYVTLREQQVLQLQKEMKHTSGVRLQIRRKDCISSIALVDALAAVWICGWKQKDHPLLYNVLHIGDQLLCIEDVTVNNASEAYKILSSTCTLYVNLVVRRVPFGQVFVIHREIEGQSLGIVQEGKTAIIQTVQADSLAARHGLAAKAKTCDGLSFTNWVLTEINGRPLNLFFKENQVRDRLNSVGRDISILVQPLDLITQLKKQLKSLRNYKEYILQ